MENLGMYDMVRVFDGEALERNLLKVRAATSARVGAVVKSDAYGFGLERALPVLRRNGVGDYFAQDLGEALRVRGLLPDQASAVYVLAGVQDGQEGAFMEHGLVPVCVGLGQLEKFNRAAKNSKKKPRAAIHFDTGMNRTGLSLGEAEELSSRWKDFAGNLDIVLYVSHMPGPFDARSLRDNERQLGRFERVLGMLPRRPASLASSRGILYLDSRFHFDLARVGYALFGGAKGFEPAVRVYAKVLQVRRVAKGWPMGYSRSYRAPRDMDVAVVNIGYRDGYSRGLSHANGWRDRIRALLHGGAGFARSYMCASGRRCPVVGAVSMNNAGIDSTGAPGLKAGDWVQVLGGGARLFDFRSANGYIPVELMVGLTRGNPNALDLSGTGAVEFEKEWRGDFDFDFS
jgi:alanine racemase